MHKSILLLLLGCLALCLTPDLSAQNYGSGKKKKKKPEPKKETRTERTTRTDDYFDDSGNLSAKLWYGGSGTFTFNSTQFESIFVVGVRPMVGYKITPAFSVGPTAGISYISYRQICGATSPDGTCRLNNIEYGVGAFGRYRFIPMIFAHVEYYVERTPSINGGVDQEGRFLTSYITDPEFNVGLGYQSESGGAVNYELAALYNTRDPRGFPFGINLRAGLNYNF